MGGVEVRGDRGDLLEGGEEIELQAADAPLEAAEPEALLLSRRLDVYDFSGEAAGLDLGAGEDRGHAGGAQRQKDENERRYCGGGRREITTVVGVGARGGSRADDA